MSPCKLSEQNFENFTIRNRFSKKTHKLLKNIQVLRLQAVITPQWLQMPKTHGQMVPLRDICQAWGRVLIFSFFLNCPFTSSFLLFIFPFSFWVKRMRKFSHSLYPFSFFVHPFPFYHNRPTPFPGRTCADPEGEPGARLPLFSEGKRY